MAKKFGPCAICTAPHFLNHTDLCKRCNASDKSSAYKTKFLKKEEKQHEADMKEAAKAEARKKEFEATQEPVEEVLPEKSEDNKEEK